MVGGNRYSRIGYYRDWAHGSGTIVGYEDRSLSHENSLAFISSNHRRLPNGNWDDGAMFQSSKSGYIVYPSQSIVAYPGNRRIPEYCGAFTVAIPPEFPLPVLRPIEAIGVEMWGQAAPAQPLMGLSNALYELKDLPGMLKQRFLDSGLYSIFDYYLALKFGWEPLLRDCRNLYFTAHGLKKALDQLLKNNGKPVRRRVERPTVVERTTLEEQVGGTPTWLHPILTNFCYGDNTDSAFKAEYVSEHREWFSARFRYWLPPKRDLTDWQWKSMMVGRLMGLNVTPGVVYQAMPWSWLVDWFSNTGAAIENLDYGVADRLIADYAFVMGSQRDFIRYTGSGSFITGENGASTNVTAVSEQYISHKRRYKASPFGFGITDSDLSPGQFAILGALGASKSR